MSYLNPCNTTGGEPCKVAFSPTFFSASTAPLLHTSFRRYAPTPAKKLTAALEDSSKKICEAVKHFNEQIGRANKNQKKLKKAVTDLRFSLFLLEENIKKIVKKDDKRKHTAAFQEMFADIRSLRDCVATMHQETNYDKIAYKETSTPVGLLTNFFSATSSVWQKVKDTASQVIFKVDAATRFPVAAAAKLATLAQQNFVYSTSLKTYFFDVVGGQFWSYAKLCAHGNESAFLTTDGAVQQLMVVRLVNGLIQRLVNQSAAIAAGFPPAQGSNYFEMSCFQQYYHISTYKGGATPTSFHKAIFNLTYILKEYPFLTGMAQRTSAWKIVRLLNNAALFAPWDGTNFYSSSTNSSGLFNGNYTILNPIGPAPFQIPISFDDGTFRILQNRASGLFEFQYDQNRQLLGTYQIYSQPLYPLFAPNTPPAGTQFMTLITPGTTGTAPALYTFDLINHQIVPSRILGSEPSNAANPAVACLGPLYPNLFAYVRPSLNATAGTWLLKFDVVDAKFNSSSVLGGEQTLNLPPQLSQLFPDVGCFTDQLKCLISLIDENSDVAFFQLNLTASNPSSPIPSSGSSSAASPSGPPIVLPTPSLATLIASMVLIGALTFTISSTLGNTLTPLSTFLTIPTGLGGIFLVATNGYTIVFPNMTTVPLNTSFSPLQVSTFLIARGTANATAAPLFLGCVDPIDLNTCIQSQSSLAQEFAIGFDTRYLISLVAIPVIVGGGLIFYFKYLRPLQQRRIEKYKKSSARREVNLKALAKK